VDQNSPAPEHSPLSVTADDRKRKNEDEELWSQGAELLADLLTQIEAFQGWDGWVNHENYDVMKERLQTSVDSFLNQHAKLMKRGVFG
jgi:hypothetical protein